MELRDLDERELRVFMGLFKLVVHADHEVSEPERAVIADLSGALGVARWNEAVAAARRAYDTVEQLEDDARLVERRGAQVLIHELLTTLAHSDELVEGEAHVLRWVSQTWGVAEGKDDVGLTEDLEDIDSFVLIADDD